MTTLAMDSVARPAQADQHRLNSAMAGLLMAVVAVSPLPLGSNKPQFWGLAAMVLALMAAWYFYWLARQRQRSRVRVRDLLVPVTLHVALCAYLVLQLLPIGQFAGLKLPVAASYDIAVPTISLDPGMTWLMLLQMVGYGLFVFLMIQVAANRDRSGTMMRGIFLIVVAYAILGITMLTQWGDTIFGLPKWAYRGSATGPFVNRNSFATFLAMGFALGCAYLLGRRPEDKLAGNKYLDVALILVGLLIIGSTLLATNSRMGAAAAASGATVVLLLGAVKLRIGVLKWAAVALAVAIGGTALFTLYGDGLLERLITADAASDLRWEVYAQVWPAIMLRPFTGYGGGSFQWAFVLFAHGPLSPDLMWDKAHSSYLQLWFELGLVVGSIPLVTLAFLGWRSLVSFWRSESTWAPGLAAIGVLVVAAVHSTVDFSLEIQADAFLLLAVVGLGADMRLRSAQPAAARGPAPK